MNQRSPFQSLGPSAFVSSARDAIQSRLERTRYHERWKVTGDASLIAVSILVTEAIERVAGTGLKAQIWMERPQKARAACKFEIAYRVKDLSEDKSKDVRERIATSVRTHLEQKGLPEGVIHSRGSTTVRRRLSVPSINTLHDDTPENAADCASEIAQIVTFLEFLDSALSDWDANKIRR